MTLWVGVDCGLSGAVAWLDQNGALLAVEDMPVMATGKATGRVKRQADGAALSRLLVSMALSRAGEDVAVMVESVASMPGQGVAGVFSLGYSAGVVAGVVAARGFPMHLVAPATWKKHFGLLKSDKELSRAAAIRLYPGASLARVKDHGRAEAILLARYAFDTLS